MHKKAWNLYFDEMHDQCYIFLAEIKHLKGEKLMSINSDMNLPIMKFEDPKQEGYQSRYFNNLVDEVDLSDTNEGSVEEKAL